MIKHNLDILTIILILIVLLLVIYIFANRICGWRFFIEKQEGFTTQYKSYYLIIEDIIDNTKHNSVIIPKMVFYNKEGNEITPVNVDVVLNPLNDKGIYYDKMMEIANKLELSNKTISNNTDFYYDTKEGLITDAVFEDKRMNINNLIFNSNVVDTINRKINSEKRNIGAYEIEIKGLKEQNNIARKFMNIYEDEKNRLNNGNLKFLERRKLEKLLKQMEPAYTKNEQLIVSNNKKISSLEKEISKVNIILDEYQSYLDFIDDNKFNIDFPNTYSYINISFEENEVPVKFNFVDTGIEEIGKLPNQFSLYGVNGMINNTDFDYDSNATFLFNHVTELVLDTDLTASNQADFLFENEFIIFDELIEEEEVVEEETTTTLPLTTTTTTMAPKDSKEEQVIGYMHSSLKNLNKLKDIE